MFLSSSYYTKTATIYAYNHGIPNNQLMGLATISKLNHQNQMGWYTGRNLICESGKVICVQLNKCPEISWICNFNKVCFAAVRTKLFLSV